MMTSEQLFLLRESKEPSPFRSIAALARQPPSGFLPRHSSDFRDPRALVKTPDENRLPLSSRSQPQEQPLNLRPWFPDKLWIQALPACPFANVAQCSRRSEGRRKGPVRDFCSKASARR